MTVTKTINEIVLPLLFEVRVMSFDAIRRHIYHGDRRNAARALAPVISAGFARQLSISVRTLPEPGGPLAAWPTQHSFDPHDIARRARARCQTVTPKRQSVLVATDKAARFYGGPSRQRLRAGHIEHDLGLSQVRSFYRRHRREELALWRGEDSVEANRGFRVKNPDAYLIDAEGTKLRAIEFVSHSYSPRKIRELLEHFDKHALPFELW